MFSTFLPALASELAFLDAAMTPVAEELGGLGRDLLEQAKSMAHSRDTESLTAPQTIETAATVALPEIPLAARAPIVVDQPQVLPHPTAKAICLMDSRISGHTPQPAVLATVKDPPSEPSCNSSASVAVKEQLMDDPERLEQAKYAALTRDKVLLTSWHTPDAEVAAALRKYGLVSELVKHFEAMASRHARVQLTVAVDMRLVKPEQLHRLTLAHSGSTASLAQGSLTTSSLASPASSMSHSSTSGTTRILSTSPAGLALAREDVVGMEAGGLQKFFAAADQLHVAVEKESRTLNPIASSDAPELCTSGAPSLIGPFPFSRPSVFSMVTALLDSALFSAILRTTWTTYLVWIKCEDAVPHLVWAREGIGTTYLESTRYNDGTATRPWRRLDAERPETYIPSYGILESVSLNFISYSSFCTHLYGLNFSTLHNLRGLLWNLDPRPPALDLKRTSLALSFFGGGLDAARTQGSDACCREGPPLHSTVDASVDSDALTPSGIDATAVAAPNLRVHNKALPESRVSEFVARSEAMIHASSMSRSLPSGTFAKCTSAGTRVWSSASASTTEVTQSHASDKYTSSPPSALVTCTSRGASAPPSASMGTATGEQLPAPDLELQKIGINLEAEFGGRVLGGRRKSKAKRFSLGLQSIRYYFHPPLLSSPTASGRSSVRGG
ncbi:hypothetical protein B0H14DRAFT_3638743 [Mycena olivaceomarginata]|nr:hypothetical protein B0H14DRAFT_3638743 [Mycena olivaceomarginata]